MHETAEILINSWNLLENALLIFSISFGFSKLTVDWSPSPPTNFKLSADHLYIDLIDPLPPHLHISTSLQILSELTVDWPPSLPTTNFYLPADVHYGYITVPDKLALHPLTSKFSTPCHPSSMLIIDPFCVNCQYVRPCAFARIFDPFYIKFWVTMYWM